jgi:hypothetical protein
MSTGITPCVTLNLQDYHNHYRECDLLPTWWVQLCFYLQRSVLHSAPDQLFGISESAVKRMFFEASYPAVKDRAIALHIPVELASSLDVSRLA